MIHAEGEDLAQNYAGALTWRSKLSMPHALVWLRGASTRETHASRRDTSLDRSAAYLALRRLFADDKFPPDSSSEEVQWLRDPLGKPFLGWQGRIAVWAERQRISPSHLHVSNTHDGEAHVVLMAWEESLVGIGVDVVHLPRLREPGKDAGYLLRFARRFMAEEERRAFEAEAHSDDEEALRLRVAAHFSVMEAASKACGTGLKIGAGMGRSTSLPKQSLGISLRQGEIHLLFGPEAQARLELLGAKRSEAYCSANAEYLVSAVLLFRH